MQTRRQLIASSGPLAVAVFTPQALAAGLTSALKAPSFGGGRFDQGVMSGEPTPNAITLWTHLDEVGGSGSVELEVATDKAFRRVVARKLVRTSSALNHGIKARVSGLKPYEQYYYRFATKRKNSPVGRFRTALPADSRQPVNFAYFSCQDFTHGFYNAHEVMRKGDYDFIVCLGDYVYSESYHSKADGTAVRDDNIGRAEPGNPDVVRAAHSLAEYREKYALYRSDKSLQKVQAKFPLVILWDDHEVQDNYAGAEGDGGLPPGKEYTAAREVAGYKAFFEAMPYFPPAKSRVYRKLTFGRTVELFLTDQRQYRRNQPCDDAVAPPCADLDQPRDLLGRKQLNWLKSGLLASKAAWKIIGNEVTMMPTKVLGGSYYTFDTWQGYPQERRELLNHIKNAKIDDVLFVTGDIHTFIAGDVRVNEDDTPDASVALEFVGGSVTSRSLGETDLDAGSGVVLKGNDANPATPQAIIDALRGINPWVDQADFDHHGFGVVKATQKGMDASMVRLSTIKRKSTTTLPAANWRYQVDRGQKTIKGVHGPK